MAEHILKKKGPVPVRHTGKSFDRNKLLMAHIWMSHGGTHTKAQVAVEVLPVGRHMKKSFDG